MNTRIPMQADAEAIGAFVDALFCYADQDTYVSLRAFSDGANKVFRIMARKVGDSLEGLAKTAAIEATMAANHAAYPVVFAPPIATFTNDSGARERDLANGLALSVECDATPGAARTRLEGLLGPATVVVASGGEWGDPASGEVEPKLHLHWRLTAPTREQPDHALLKQARQIAQRLVGADASNTPMVHPIRWPGSWHRKTTPRLARIVALNEAREIDLREALETLQEAAAVAGVGGFAGSGAKEAPTTGTGEARATAELIRAVMTAEGYHAPLAALAMRYLKGGMPDAQTVLTLQGFMLAVPVEQRDAAGGTVQHGRWQSRFGDIPRAVQTARAKIGERPADAAQAPGGIWPEPVDFLGDAELTGAPQLRPEHLPEAIAPFVFDTAARMGVDPAAVALCAAIACASVIFDDWAVQPRVHDDTWTENARLWGALVGDPSIMKTPVLTAATKPVDALDAAARATHADAMRKWKQDVAAAKADGNPPGAVPPQPKLKRWMVEGTTTEALSEVLRDDDDAKQTAPARKVLVRQDEMSGWLGDMDRYKAGGRGGGDRAAYLRLFNGGRYVIDRIGRGTFAIPNWSACVVGGIQPEAIQRIAREAADDGLLQRFLYCVPAGQADGEDRRPDQAALNRYQALFPALAVLHPRQLDALHPWSTFRPVVFHRDAHADREAMNALAKAQAAMPDTSQRLKAALGKWPGIFARIALTFHLIEIADVNASGEQPPVAGVISPETARRTAAYMRDILLPHLLRADALLFLTPQTGHARWIAGFILANDEAREAGRITLRAVTRAYGPLRAPELRRQLLEVMETLEVMGWLRAEPPENVARHPAAWRINPAVHASFAARAAAERERRQRVKEEMLEAIHRHRGRTPNEGEFVANVATRV